MLLHSFSPDMKKLVFVFCVLLALGIAAHYNKETLMAWMSPEKEGTPTPAAPAEAKPVAQPAPAEQPPVEPVVAEVSEEVKALQFAAEGGDAVAQCNLGLCLESGEGITSNAVAAVEMYRKSAEQGNAAACFNLARCYVNGFGVEPDVAQFISWCRKGAEAGNADAMEQLGMCMEEYVEYLMAHPHIAVYENGKLKYEITRVSYNNQPTATVEVSRNAAEYTVSMDNCGGVIVCMSY